MKRKDILIVIVLLFIFALVWIGGSIYRSIVGSTILETTSEDIRPIVPVFDTKTINRLKERQKITPSFELESVTPTPITPLVPEISSQEASEGGQLPL